MKAVFLDTVGLIAIWNRDDQWHDSAKSVYEEFIRLRTTLVTTSAVLYECGNASARRPYRINAWQLREQLLASGDLIVPTEDDENQAWHNYRQGHAANAGIVDQISFVVMRRFGLTKAFSNDAHFRTAGFETLIQTPV